MALDPRLGYGRRSPWIRILYTVALVASALGLLQEIRVTFDLILLVFLLAALSR